MGQEGVIFSPVSKERQIAAVQFLNENAFVTPAWLVNPAILNRIEPVGAIGRIRNAQNAVLSYLLSSARLARLVEQEAMEPRTAWAPLDFLTTVRKGIWTELHAPQVKIDAYRRGLQRYYLEVAASKLNATLPSTAGGDEGPMYRAELHSLRSALVAGLPKASDRATRAHLSGMIDQIAKDLRPQVRACSDARLGPQDWVRKL